MSQASSSSGMRSTFFVYGAILLIAVVQVAVAIAMGPSLWRMLILAAIQTY